MRKEKTSAFFWGQAAATGSPLIQGEREHNDTERERLVQHTHTYTYDNSDDLFWVWGFSFSLFPDLVYRIPQSGSDGMIPHTYFFVLCWGFGES